MHELQNRIIQDIKNAKNKKIIIGTSLGGILSLMITNKIKV